MSTVAAALALGGPSDSRLRHRLIAVQPAAALVGNDFAAESLMPIAVIGRQMGTLRPAQLFDLKPE
jgi:hypothetical protein